MQTRVLTVDMIFNPFPLSYQGKEQKIHYIINDTRMQIFLPEALKGNGDSLKINISYNFGIPEQGSDRMGRVETENGWIYTIAQWFPRMCVYDNVVGWNALPYIGAGEFYLEYGDYDFSITTSGKQLVVASGELLNPSEVLTPEQIKRLDDARNSDKTVMIRNEEEAKNRTGRSAKRQTGMAFQMQSYPRCCICCFRGVCMGCCTDQSSGWKKIACHVGVSH